MGTEWRKKQWLVFQEVQKCKRGRHLATRLAQLISPARAPPVLSACNIIYMKTTQPLVDRQPFLRSWLDVWPSCSSTPLHARRAHVGLCTTRPAARNGAADRISVAGRVGRSVPPALRDLAAVEGRLPQQVVHLQAGTRSTRRHARVGSRDHLARAGTCEKACLFPGPGVPSTCTQRTSLCSSHSQVLSSLALSTRGGLAATLSLQEGQPAGFTTLRVGQRHIGPSFRKRQCRPPEAACLHMRT
jgi:hypothetical protein